MAYCTSDQVASMLGATFSIPSAWLVGTSPNRRIDTAIAAAKELIDAVTGNTFEALPRTLLMDGDATVLLTTTAHTRLPIASVTQVVTRAEYTEDFDTDGEVVAANAYDVSPSRRGIERIDGEEWPAGKRNIRVRAVFGRVITPLPVTEAAVILVREAISPGYAATVAEKESEHFSDGYSYTLARKTGTPGHMQRSTGSMAADARIANYILRFPAGLGGY